MTRRIDASGKPKIEAGRRGEAHRFDGHRNQAGTDPGPVFGQRQVLATFEKCGSCSRSAGLPGQV
jgi:hypothetical protein